MEQRQLSPAQVTAIDGRWPTMRVVVSSDSRYARTPDGRVWTWQVPDYPVWRRYLTAFDKVRVVARVCDQPEVSADALRVDGEGVEVWPLPYYIGPWQYLRCRSSIIDVLADASGPTDAVIVRVPSFLGSHLARIRRQRRLPYAAEVVADPYDVLAPGVLQPPLRPLLRHRCTARLRHECRTAVGVSYVTESYLQARYPCAPGAPTAAISSIDLVDDAFVPAPRSIVRQPAEAVLMSAGTMEQLYKGIDTLIEALARLRAAGLDVRLVHLGTGRLQHQLEKLVADRGVIDRVTFAGWIQPGAPLRAKLDEADLFVMPSRTEGLPRALLDAMARALPAIGTNVGGIPELLPAEDLVDPDDPAALASAIAAMLAAPERMAAASARNLSRARQFSRTCLDPRRTAFYQAVRDATASRTACHAG
ncbi:glycosyltransferase [Micromonospora sp. NBRC 110038]|nr:glycosyltransferase [Micromonospora sp. NBRC 110038]